MSPAAESWAITGLLLSVGLMLLFVVFTLLGFFVDPTLGENCRIFIVIGWGIVGLAVYVPVLCIVRHG